MIFLILASGSWCCLTSARKQTDSILPKKKRQKIACDEQLLLFVTTNLITLSLGLATYFIPPSNKEYSKAGGMFFQDINQDERVIFISTICINYLSWKTTWLGEVIKNLLNNVEYSMTMLDLSCLRLVLTCD